MSNLRAPAKPPFELAPIAAPPAATPARAAHGAVAPAPDKAAKPRPLALGLGAALMVLVAAGTYAAYRINGLSPTPTPRVPAPRPIAAPQSAMTIVPLEASRGESGPAARVGTASKATASLAPSITSFATVAAQEADKAPRVLQATRADERARVAPEVASGYEALRRGDLAGARQSYATAHAADPASLDAALGLATVEARGGQHEAAAELYRRALDIEPRNPTALAGLAALSDASRLEALEPHIQREIAQRPDAAPLHFLLGNVHASLSEWTQAQAAYFEAHRLDPDNADVMHNLAVSLDRLGQPRLAASFYRRALDGAHAGPTQFDSAGAARRLAEIEPAR